MKKFMIAALALGLTACNQDQQDEQNAQAESASPGIIAEANAAEQKEVFASEDEKVGYAIGLTQGGGLSQHLPELNLEQYFKGFEHGFKGEKPLMTQQEAMITLNAFQSRKVKEVLEKAKAASDEFLAKNKEREGVVTTESGLQYEVMATGPEDGAKPGINDKVKVHYHGTLVDGSVFDSSVQRDKPAEFRVGGVIKGWVEALQLMRKGDKYKLYIPSELAYGERGAGPGSKIGPNAALIFEVELLDIMAQPQG